MKAWKSAIVLLFGIGLAGCQMTAPKTVSDTSSLDQIEQSLEPQANEAERDRLPPAAIADAMMPGFGAGPEQEERFDISVNGIDARSFFTGLVQETPYNMVVHPEVSGAISLDLKNVSLEEVMNIIRDVYGFPYKRRGNLYQVLPAGLRTEVFKIDYLNVKRQGYSQMQVSAGGLSEGVDSGGGGGRSSTNSSSSRRGGNNQGGGVGAQVNTEVNADFWSELGSTLNLLVQGEAGASVVVTPQTGIVVVRAMPEPMEAVRDYLQRSELILRRQVIIEAKILEVELREGFQAGIDWQALATPGDDNLLEFSLGAADVINSSDALSSGARSGVFGLNFNVGDFSGIIDLLDSQGNVQVLSSPRISTVNNQKAVIKVGTDEFFVTEVTNETTASDSATTTAPTIQLTPFFSGIALDVTPQINGADEVVLHIHPTVSEVQDQNKIITLGDDVFNLPLALSSVRESDSIVYARSGEVVVIGGLMQTSTNDTNADLPGLARIPFLSPLFSQRKEEMVKSELVILLRPIVLDSTSNARYLDDSLQRIRSIRRDMETGGNL